MRRSSSSLIVLAALIACTGGSTTPAGPVGKTIDLRSRIQNPEVAARAPAEDKATVHEHALDVHGVKAKIVWRTFEDTGARYIVSAGWHVVTPASGVTVESLGPMNPENAGTVAAPVQAEIVRIRWKTKGACSSQMGEQSVKIDASGAATTL